MNDEAAETRGPSGTSQDAPEPAASTTSAPPPPPPAAEPPPAWAAPPPETPTWGPGTFTRDKLVRPRQGRYVSGVCAALARATNTDPVLWRVLVAVLGILSGVGLLLYLIGWLIIPSEGDTASPIESLLGKGRSGMAPLSVVLLGAAAVISFGFIMHDGMRASLLGAAVVLGAILLIKRSGSGGSAETATFPPPTPGATPPAGFPADQPVAAYVPPGFPPAAAAPAEEPVTAPIPPGPPTVPFRSTAPPAPTMPQPPFAPPVSGYRPPFAPHGPYATTAAAPRFQPPPPRHPKPPKPPRERSKLGRLTFFAVLMVIGVMAAFDMAGASIAVSAYFAAALVTIALGLILGAWLGRARGLIALALLTSIGLGISTGVERFGGDVGSSFYRPQTIGAVADRYDFTAGNATLDLRDVDFTGKQQSITLTMKLGQMRVLLPPTVDTTATIQMDTGRALILGKEFTDRSDGGQVVDLGNDGEGGGMLKLDLQLDTGNVEVLR